MSFSFFLPVRFSRFAHFFLCVFVWVYLQTLRCNNFQLFFFELVPGFILFVFKFISRHHDYVPDACSLVHDGVVFSPACAPRLRRDVSYSAATAKSCAGDAAASLRRASRERERDHDNKDRNRGRDWD